MNIEKRDKYFKEGVDHLNSKRYDEAIQDFDKAIEIDEDYKEAYLERGKCCRYNNQLKEAMEDFNRAIEIDKNYKAAYLQRGWYYGHENQLEKAIENFNRAIEIDKDYKEAYFFIGICYYFQKMFKEAIEEFNKAIEIDRDYKKAYLYMGWSYYNKGKYILENVHAALDCCNKALEIDPYYKEIYQLRRYIYEACGETNNAILDEVRYKDVDFGNYIEENIDGENCTKLCDLFLKVMNLKDKLIYKGENPVAHYTKINSIKHLIKPSEDKNGDGRDYPKLRLNNVSYMNDPTEGDVFKKLLEQKSDNIELINNLYNTSGKDKREVIQGKSNTFLASFSKSIDTSLPMWVQYTDNGQGCCLVFKSDFFDKEDNNSTLLESTNGDNKFKTEMEKGINSNNDRESYCLYEVKYIEEKKKDEFNLDDSDLEQLIEEIAIEVSALLSEKGEKHTEFSKDKKEEKRKIKSIIINILDQVRFLFKSKDYEHEHEVRLIKFTNDVKYTGDAEGYRVPHVYIDMERELEIEEVVLGPKVSEPIEIANYLYYTGKVDKVTKSHIKYK